MLRRPPLVHLHDSAGQRNAAALVSVTFDTLSFARLVASGLEDRGGGGGGEDEIDWGDGGG